MIHVTPGDQALETGDNGFVQLWDWRRRIFQAYAAVRANPEPQQAWQQWRAVRDAMFRDHPQSPIDATGDARTVSRQYFGHDPALRLQVALAPVRHAASLTLPAGGDGRLLMQPFATTDGLAETLGRELTLFWITGYGGGVFLPFSDATSGQHTYGAGRYLLDTIKGADLGSDAAGQTILDFNFAYNPSCSYSDRYVCPLAPDVNRLPAAVRAGELHP